MFLLGSVVLISPNTQEILRNYWVSSDPKPAEEQFSKWALIWKATPSWAFAMSVVIVLALGSIKGYSTFLYYKF